MESITENKIIQNKILNKIGGLEKKCRHDIKIHILPAWGKINWNGENEFPQLSGFNLF